MSQLTPLATPFLLLALVAACGDDDANDEASVCAAGSTGQFVRAQERAWFDVYCPTQLPEGFALDFVNYAADVRVPEGETPRPNTGSLTAVFVNESGARIDFLEGNLGGDLFPVWRQYPPPEPSEVAFGDAFDALLYSSYEAGGFGTQPVVVWAQESGLPQYVIVADGVDEAALGAVAEGMMRVGGLTPPSASPSESLQTTPTRTPSARGWEGNPRATRPVAYLDSQNRLWRAAADGRDRRVVAERPCEEGTEPLDRSLSWSLDEEMLGVICSNQRGISPFADQVWRLVVFDRDGRVVTSVDNVNRYEWSARSDKIAYQTADILQEPRLPRVGLVDLSSGEERTLPDRALLLAWPRERQLLLGLEPIEATGDILIFPEYDAVWYDIDTGATERVPRLDDNARLWVGPGGERAVVLTDGSDREGGGLLMALYDLVTGEEVLLDAVIGYPSEGVPDRLLAFSADGERIYWADFDFLGPGFAIKTASLDGGASSSLGRVPGFVVDVSGDGLVLYTPDDNPGALVLHDGHTGAETSISDRRAAVISPP